MKHKIKILTLAVFGFLLIHSLLANELNVVVIKNNDQFGQSGKNSYKNLQSFEALGIISRLAFQKDVILNFEETPNDKQIISFNVSDGTRLRDLLEKFLAQDPNYIYVIRDGIINVFPKATEGDETYLFNLRLKYFDVDHKNRREIMTLLINEIKAEYPGKYQVMINGKVRPMLGYLVINGSVDFDLDLIPMTFNGSDFTVREILNVISRKNNTFWNAIQQRNAGIQTGQMNVIFEKENQYGIQSTGKRPQHGDHVDDQGNDDGHHHN